MKCGLCNQEIIANATNSKLGTSLRWACHSCGVIITETAYNTIVKPEEVYTYTYRGIDYTAEQWTRLCNLKVFL